MEEGQCGTYLRQTRASSGPRVGVAKTYRDETKTNISARSQWPSSAVEYRRNSLLYSTSEEGHRDLTDIFIFVSFHLYMSQRRPPSGQTMLSSVVGKCCSVPPSIFDCFLPFQVFLIILQKVLYEVNLLQLSQYKDSLPKN